MSQENEITQTALNEEARTIALSILEELKEESCSLDFYEFTNEIVDGHEWVIYYHHALKVCTECGTSDGENMVDEIGGHTGTYSDISTRLAYCILHCAVMEYADEMTEAAEEYREAAELVAECEEALEGAEEALYLVEAGGDKNCEAELMAMGEAEHWVKSCKAELKAAEEALGEL